MKKHKCKQLREVGQHPDKVSIDIVISIGDDNTCELSFFSWQGKVFVLEVVIEYCPFCGKKLKSGK